MTKRKQMYCRKLISMYAITHTRAYYSFIRSSILFDKQRLLEQCFPRRRILI